MIKISPMPKAEYLRQSFTYDPEVGVLLWADRDNVPTHVNNRFAGTVAGSYSSSGIMVRLDGVLIAAHRIIYVMMFGDVLGIEDEIDHIDLNNFNNKWANLRKATREQNSRNRTVQYNSTSGIKGIDQLPSGSWRARISGVGLGSYASLDDAIEAYNKASKLLHGNHGRLTSQPT